MRPLSPFVLLLLFALCASSAHAAWRTVQSLNYRRAFGCTAFFEEYVLLLGGSGTWPAVPKRSASSGLSPTSVPAGTTAMAGNGSVYSPLMDISSFDLVSNDAWRDNFFGQLLEGIAGSSSCASIGDRVTVAYLGAQGGGPVSSEFLCVTHREHCVRLTTPLQKRIQSTILMFNDSYFIVGGVDAARRPIYEIEQMSHSDLANILAQAQKDAKTKQPLQQQVRLEGKTSSHSLAVYEHEARPQDLSSPSVYCRLDRPLCDCQYAARNENVMLVCTNCSGDPVGSHATPRADLFSDWLLLDLATCTYFTLPEFPTDLTSRRQAEVVSISTVVVAQYCVGVVFFSGDLLPSVVLWDLYLFQWHVVRSASAKPRIFGATAAVGENLMYAGGVDIVSVSAGATANNKSGVPSMVLGETSATVELMQIVKASSTEVLNPNRTFTAGIGTVGILCSVNNTVRISTAVRCTGRAPGSPDTVCPASGQVDIPVPTVAGLYFVCASFGSCVGPKLQRIACPFGNFSDFSSCNLAGCCYCDISKMCFGPRPHYLPNVNESNNPELYYVLNVPSPIEVLPAQGGAGSAAQSKFMEFLRSAPGVIAAILVVFVFLVLVVFTGRVVARRCGLDGTGDGDSNPGDYLDQEHASILGVYKPIRRLGAGAFGSVHLVEKRATGVHYALKYIPCPNDSDREAAMREYDSIRAVPRHPSLIRIYDIRMNWAVDDNVELESNVNASTKKSGSGGSGDKSKSSGSDESKGNRSGKQKRTTNLQDQLLGEAHRARYVCLVMDYFPEGDLARYIWDICVAKQCLLPETWIVGVVGRQVCSALALLHSQTPPVIHRDLKPENLLLATERNAGGTPGRDLPANRAVITDFGLATKAEKNYLSTRTGSLNYLSPETWKKRYSALSDMWSVGCILYGAATGRVTSDTARVMFHDVQERGFVKEITAELRTLGYSTQFVELVLALLKPDPHERLSAEACLARIDAEPLWAATAVPVPKPGQMTE